MKRCMTLLIVIMLTFLSTCALAETIEDSWITEAFGETMTLTFRNGSYSLMTMSSNDGISIPDSVTSYGNLTLHYDENGVNDTEESFFYGGAYEWANSPEIAVVPTESIHPSVSDANADEDLQSAADIDVFEFNKLSKVFVHGSEMTVDGDHQNYTVYLRENVYSGGSDGYYDNWVTEEGVLCDTTADLDGDGEQEYLTYEINVDAIDENDYSYTESTGSLVVYEMNDGNRSEAARIRDIGTLMPMGESAIRLIDTDAGMYIAAYYYGIGDGAVAYLNMRIYRYDGTKFNQELYATISSGTGISWIVKGVDIEGKDFDIESAICDYIWNGDASGLQSHGMAIGPNLIIHENPLDFDYESYEESLDYSGFDLLLNELAPFGMILSYQLRQDGYMGEMQLIGGETFIHVDDQSTAMNTTDICLLTSLDHKPEMFSSVPSYEEYDNDYDDYEDYEDMVEENSYAFITGDVNLRDQPNLDGQVLISIPQGSMVDFLGDVSTDNRGIEWYNISYEGWVGWVSSKFTVIQ